MHNFEGKITYNSFRVLLLFCGLLISATRLTAQNLTLQDSFSDGDFTTNPTWSGDINNFVVTTDQRQMLRLNASNSGSSYLSTSSKTAYGKWEFYIRLDFAPSGSNRAEVFLISDKRDLTQNVNGYAIQIGERGSHDVFHLIRYDGGTASEPIVSDTTDVSKGGKFTLSVKRSLQGVWILAVAKGYDSTPVPYATGTDNVYKTSSYFGLKLHYTSTRTDKFYFDNFRISQAPVQILNVKVLSRKQIQLMYSAPIAATSIRTSDFSVDHHIGFPQNITETSNSITLHFNQPLSGGSYNLHIQHLNDSYDHPVPDTSISFTLYDIPQKRDIVINEFMYDPPENLVEYVELYNASDKIFNLKDWRLEDGSSAHRPISSRKLILKPRSYIVLTSDTTTLFHHFHHGPFYQMPDFPTLNNTYDLIKLTDSTGQMIDSLKYYSSWGGNGTALERRSYYVLSTYKENWGNSPAALGGTPGLPNEISPDKTAPFLKATQIKDDRHITFNFSEWIQSPPNKDWFRFQPSIAIDSVLIHHSAVQLVLEYPLKHRLEYTLVLSGITDLFGNTLHDTTARIFYNPDDFPPKIRLAQIVSSYSQITASFNEPVKITSNTRFQLNGTQLDSSVINTAQPQKARFYFDNKLSTSKSYKLRIVNLADTSGNILKDTTVTVAHPPSSRDVVINEIMYNPITDNRDNKPDQCEYVEFYNRGDVTVTLDGCYLHDAPDENGNVTKRYPVRDSYGTLLPHQYAVWYADTARLFHHSRIFRSFKPKADSTHFFRINHSTLSLSSQKGAVYLSNSQGGTIDSVDYSDSWEDPNILDHRGISIERINPNGPSDVANNWGSSANRTGGTPAMANSIMIQSKPATNANAVELSPNPFSPDHDGFQDNLSISYHFNESDYMLRIRIFDRYGRIVRHLIENKLAGSKGTIIWNGLSDNGARNRVGIYIVLIQAYNSSKGPSETFKKEAVLARKF